MAATRQGADEDWSMLGEFDDGGGNIPTQTPTHRRNGSNGTNEGWSFKPKGKLLSLVSTAKAKVWNMFRPLPTDLPPFTSSPIWMLGVCYCKEDYPEHEEGAETSEPGDIPLENMTDNNQQQQNARDGTTNSVQPRFLRAFLDDFASRIWFTYRNYFPRLEPSHYTTDTGWGCMLRTGQMMLAQAFIVHFLKRDWRKERDINNAMFRKILRWFADEPTPTSFYSIHNITQLASRFSVQPGDWFEPTKISHVLEALVKRHGLEAFTLLVARDCVVYRSRVRRRCVGVPGINGGRWRSLVLIVPVRLGAGSVINPAYLAPLRSVFTFPQSLGVIGGKPGSSYWFVAVQDDNAFYLDPHMVQDAVKMDGVAEFAVDTYHPRVPQRMALKDVDPSMALGFYCRDEADFEDLCRRVQAWSSTEQSSAPEREDVLPLFSVSDEASPYNESDSESEADDSMDDLIWVEK